MTHDPTPQRELKAAMVLFKAVIDMLPQLTAPRPAFPMIVSPCTGDKVDGGTYINVNVKTNQTSILHRVKLLDADGSPIGSGSGELVTFGPDPSDPTKILGTAYNIGIPAAIGAQPDTDFIVRCRPDTGDDHRILITRKSTLPPIEFTVDIDVDPDPPYIVNQLLTFEAEPEGGTGPYRVTWEFGDGTFGTGTPVTHKYTTPGNYTVWVHVMDSSSPPKTKSNFLTPIPIASSV
jgi:hypothetical protein